MKPRMDARMGIAASAGLGEGYGSCPRSCPVEMFSFRVMTYNVHGCVGVDFRRSEERVAQAIGRLNPDIVGLQELDVQRRRSSGVDQAKRVAEILGFHHLFHPAMRWADEHYGDAILSRWPMEPRRAGDLPSENAFLYHETRGASWVEIDAPCGAIHVINTHFGVGSMERMDQAQALAGVSWIGAAREHPLVLVGDLNSPVGSLPYKVIGRLLADARLAFPRERSAPTYPALFPVLSIDHIFLSRHFEVSNVSIPRDRHTRVASDHLPLVADLIFR